MLIRDGKHHEFLQIHTDDNDDGYNNSGGVSGDDHDIGARFYS